MIMENQTASMPTPDTTNPETNSITADQADRLVKLKSLLDNGVITQEEFDDKKKQILNELKQTTSRQTVKPLLVLAGVAAVILISIAIFIISNAINKAHLKEALVKEWYAIADPLILVLDIDENYIEYRSEGAYIGSNTIGYFKWKPAGKNKIKVDRFGEYETFTVSFSDDGEVLAISPDITATDEIKFWVHLDS